MRKSVKPLSRRVTIKDIAAMANVSIGTVDRVLHKRGEVNQETHDRVMTFVEELGYTPNLLAKSLALKKNYHIAAIIPNPDDDNPYWNMPLAGLRKAIEELNDFNTKISVSQYDPGEESSFAEAFDNLLDQGVDGIILAPNFHEASLKWMVECKSRNIPVILIDNNLDEVPLLAYFGQDALQSGTVAAKLMHYGLPEGSLVLILNLARRKAITRHMQRREQGFVNYYKNEVPVSGIRTLRFEIDISRETEPCDTLQILLKRHPDAHGIFVTNSRSHKVARCLCGMQGKKPMLIGYDLTDDNLEYLEQGIIDYLICQKPEDQGYRAAMAMFNYLLTGRKTDKVNYSPIDIITGGNVNYYKPANKEHSL